MFLISSGMALILLWFKSKVSSFGQSINKDWGNSSISFRLRSRKIKFLRPLQILRFTIRIWFLNRFKYLRFLSDAIPSGNSLSPLLFKSRVVSSKRFRNSSDSICFRALKLQSNFCSRKNLEISLGINSIPLQHQIMDRILGEEDLENNPCDLFNPSLLAWLPSQSFLKIPVHLSKGPHRP